MVQTLEGHKGWVSSVAVNAKGDHALTGSWDLTAKLWDLSTGYAVGQPMSHPGYVTRAQFSPDDRVVLTSCVDGAARLWRGEDGRPIRELARHPIPIFDCCFSADGRLVATASRDRTCQIWDAVSGAPLGEPRQHDAFVNSVAFCGQEAAVVTGTSAGLVQVWPVLLPDLAGASREAVVQATELWVGSRTRKDGLAQPLDDLELDTLRRQLGDSDPIHQLSQNFRPIPSQRSAKAGGPAD
ncbi:MAG: hypothetical protein U0992_19545 [Planctomycetaceae bacterium]